MRYVLIPLILLIAGCADTQGVNAVMYPAFNVGDGQIFSYCATGYCESRGRELCPAGFDTVTPPTFYYFGIDTMVIRCSADALEGT